MSASQTHTKDLIAKIKKNRVCCTLFNCIIFLFYCNRNTLSEKIPTVSLSRIIDTWTHWQADKRKSGTSTTISTSFWSVGYFSGKEPRKPRRKDCLTPPAKLTRIPCFIVNEVACSKQTINYTIFVLNTVLHERLHPTYSPASLIDHWSPKLPTPVLFWPYMCYLLDICHITTICGILCKLPGYSLYLRLFYLYVPKNEHRYIQISKKTLFT